MTSTNGAPAVEDARGPQPDVDLKARRAWRIGGWGTLVLGGLLTAVAAATGSDGRIGALYFFVGALIACLAGATYAVFSAVVDSFRGRDVGRGRVVAACVLGALSLLLPVSIFGIAAQAA